MKKGKKKSTGRKCSICTHKQKKKINSAIGEGVSFRAISRQMFESEKQRDSVRRHAENCLKLEIKALIRENKIAQAIDHYEEIREQLDFAKELRQASREYLLDPESGKISLEPRATDIQVIYEDPKDKNAQGKPKRKKCSLQELVLRIEKVYDIEATVVKTYDLRKYAIDAINVTDTVLDKSAKLEGLYQKERENVEILEQTARNIVRAAELYPKSDLDKLIETGAADARLSKQALADRVEALQAQEITTTIQ